jgi:hypothetical protein
MESQRELENGLVLDALQASLGLVSSSMSAISVQLDAGDVVLHFALLERTPEVDEDIDDMVFELDALREGSTRILTAIHVGSPDAAWPGRAGRLIYLARRSGNAQ